MAITITTGLVPAGFACTRLLFVAPYFRVIPPRRDRLLPKVGCQGPRCDNATPFASIRLGQGLALDKLPVPKAHPLDIVPCPAHNQRFEGDSKLRRTINRAVGNGIRQHQTNR